MCTKKLRSINAYITAGCMLLFITACTSNDNTANNSATDTTTAKPDTTSTAIDTNPPVTSVDTSSAKMKTDTSVKKVTSTKKRGRATVSIMPENKNAKILPDKLGIYEKTDVRPAYVGGQSALDDYINNNIEYPQTAIDNNKEGSVNVEFVVDENGKVSNAKAVGNKLGDGLDEEAVRAVSSMPAWTPGEVKGKKVKTRLTIPIAFKIQE